MRELYGTIFAAAIVLSSHGAFDVRDSGAKGNGVAKDTIVDQKAIGAAHAAGGGEVLLAKGVYLSGSPFANAKPVWSKGQAEELNASVRFKATFDAEAGTRPCLRITGTTAYVSTDGLWATVLRVLRRDSSVLASGRLLRRYAKGATSWR